MKRPTQKKPHKDNKNESFIGFLFLLFAVLVGTYALHEKKSEKKSLPINNSNGAQIRSNDYEQRVNLHLRMMETAKQIARHRVEVENRKTAPGIDEGYSADDKNYWRLDMQPDDVSQRVYEDLKRESKSWQTPDGEIQESLADEQQRKEYDQAYMEEYVKAYKANARKQGFDVIIDKDYVVRGVRPLRTPSQTNPSASGGVE